jgi:hypothetical protein
MDRHSLKILNQLREYDSFLDSLKVICDMGCGTGEDITWWATLMTRDDPPRPYNYHCFAVDRDATKLAKLPKLSNIFPFNNDFTKRSIPGNTDLMWTHDSLQYAHNPIDTLRMWNEQMNVNGMLVISVMQTSGVEYNKYYSQTHSGCFYHFTPTNLIYMLAVNGFDCRDAYLLKQFNDPWLQVAVYKSPIPPMDPATTTWNDLIDAGLLHPTIENSITKHGYLRQEDIVMPWLDRENYYVDYVSSWTEIPEEARIPTINGIFNPVAQLKESIIEQAPKVVKETKLSAPVGVLRAPKKKYD